MRGSASAAVLSDLGKSAHVLPHSGVYRWDAGGEIGRSAFALPTPPTTVAHGR